MKFTLFFGINWSRLFRELVQSIFHQKDVLNFFSWLGFGPSKIWQIFVCLFTYLNKHRGSWKSPQMIIGPSSFQQKKPQLCSYPGLARNFFLARRYFQVKVENWTEDIYVIYWSKNFHLIQPSLWSKIKKSSSYIYILFLFLFRLLIFLIFIFFPPFLHFSSSPY